MSVCMHVCMYVSYVCMYVYIYIWCEEVVFVATSVVMASPMTLYHSLSPIPNTLYRCIRLYSESMQHDREGKVAISRTQRNIVRYSSSVLQIPVSYSILLQYAMIHHDISQVQSKSANVGQTGGGTDVGLESGNCAVELALHTDANTHLPDLLP